ncbi:ABC transporter ATP-binding protein [Marinobacter sp. F4206]|uniref:ABC transporter ATP-binding protein n=1 Tax=Marinobacter sp. F4206 TaxID=2861777 RepID=UPI001C5EB142|nr:ABC transporter ATP-binding protein [Marinobacter sp. F4206]MBW4934552.1 ABC transporter ATP-binding protein [Marinobacter sp. F4206]
MKPTTESAPHRPRGPALALEASDLSHLWDDRQLPIAFPDLALPAGEHLFLHGPSGSGKSTLLSLLSGMLKPATGGVRLLGTPIHQLSAGKRDQFRAHHIGVIFQQFNLVPYLTAEGNVTLPCRLSAQRRDATDPDPVQESHRLLTALAIPRDCWRRSVTRLSIGQQQRIAAARALIGGPEIILADEPTSALDSDNRDRFLDLLLTLAEERNTSVLFVSHDRALAQHFTHQVRLGGEGL